MVCPFKDEYWDNPFFKRCITQIVVVRNDKLPAYIRLSIIQVKNKMSFLFIW